MENCRGRGKPCKFCAAMLALLILAHSVFFPARARATGTLAAIAGATVISAWLMTCGIYPYVTDDGQTFGEWGAGQLRDLWNSYIDSFADGQTPSGGTRETFDKISGFVTGKTIAIASGFWSELRAFASWIVRTFSVTDNQTGLQLGTTSAGPVPYYSSTPSLSQLRDGISLIGNASRRYYSYGLRPETIDKIPAGAIVAVATTDTSNPYHYVLCGGLRTTTARQLPYWNIFTDYNASGSVVGGDSSLSFNNFEYETRGNISLWVSGSASTIFQISQANVNLITVPKFGSYSDALDYFFGLVDYVPVIADTKTVSIPDALPETATHGGLTVPDALTPSAPAITDVIQQGVTDRTQPLVVPTVVEIPADMEITDDGTIIENPVVTPADIPINADAYTLPASITTVFPFSIPWDIYRVFQALNAEPQLPEVTIKFPALGTAEEDYDVVISIPPKQWESDIEPFLIWFRRVELVVMCVGITLAMARFIKR